MKELINSREIFTVVELNIRIRGNIFHIYSPISWKIFLPISTVNNRGEKKMPTIKRSVLYFACLFMVFIAACSV